MNYDAVEPIGAVINDLTVHDFTAAPVGDSRPTDQRSPVAACA